MWCVTALPTLPTCIYAVHASTFQHVSVWCVPHCLTLPTSQPGCWSGKRRLGEVSPELVATAAEANRSWLEDCLVLLLCVLALDRFADYGSDQVS